VARQAISCIHGVVPVRPAVSGRMIRPHDVVPCCAKTSAMMKTPSGKLFCRAFTGDPALYRPVPYLKKKKKVSDTRMRLLLPEGTDMSLPDNDLFLPPT
jgi:hypothetical protein